MDHAVGTVEEGRTFVARMRAFLSRRALRRPEIRHWELLLALASGLVLSLAYVGPMVPELAFVAPAVFLYVISRERLTPGAAAILGFVFVMCGAFRLARFNLGQTKLNEKHPYMGLPIPSAAVTLISYPLFCYEIWGALRFPKVLVTMIIAFSGLMVSGIEYETLPKFHLGNKKNKMKLIYVFVFIIALLINPRLILFPFGLLYVLSGVVREGYSLFHAERQENVT